MENRKPAIKFEINKPVSGVFKYPKSYDGTAKGRDGKEFDYHCYSFTSQDGEENSFFASPKLHEKLSKYDDLQGRSFTVTKVISKDEHGNIKTDKTGNIVQEFMVSVDMKLPAHEPQKTEDGISAAELGFPVGLSEL